MAHGQALLRRVREHHAGRVRYEQDRADVLLLLLLRPAQEGVPPAQGPQARPRGYGAVRPAQHRRRRGERDGARSGCGGVLREEPQRHRVSRSAGGEAQGSGEKPRKPREGHREGRGQRYGDTTPHAARGAEERPERCHRDGKRPRVAVRGQAQHPGVLRQVPARRRERPGDSRPGLRVFRGQGLSVRRQARREHVVLRGRQAGNHVAGLVLAG